MQRQQEQMHDLDNKTGPRSSSIYFLTSVTMNTPSFAAFEPISELWNDYWARFQTFMMASSVPQERRSQVSF